MHPAFANITYGPFHTAYHLAACGPDFREQLSELLEEQLIPQLEEPYTTAAGTLTAKFNEEKYCGPNSAVKNRYELDFCFSGLSGNSEVKASLLHDPASGRFAPWNRKYPVLLVTPRLKAIRTVFENEISRNLRKYWKAKRAGGPCPACGLPLDVHSGNYHFRLSCPKGCVEYIAMA